VSGPADRAASNADLGKAPVRPLGGAAARSAPDNSLVPGVDELVRVVALDGPAGSGKSTVARLVAKRLGWRFVDTGATYRAVTLAVLRAGVPLDDEAAVIRAAEAAHVILADATSGAGVLLNGEDVSAEIRGAEVTGAVSLVSAIPAVRAKMIDLQRRAMGTHGAVVEGRDIATVVAPRAAVKVYLDATPEARALRRAADSHTGLAPTAGPAAGPSATDPLAPVPSGASGALDNPSSARVGLAEQVQRDLRRRDALDSKTNALKASDGAVHLETSRLTLDQVVQAVLDLAADAGFTAGERAAGSVDEPT
jgi:cytidylate kinase